MNDETALRMASEAFWREQEAGNLPRDRGGYVKQGFIAGYLAALERVTP